MKKILACIGAILVSAGLFLLLPHVMLDPPEMGTQPLGMVYMLFPTAALLYGALIPFVCFGDRSVALIEGAVFAVFAWEAGWLYPAISLAGTVIYVILMLGGALAMTALRHAIPIRFKPTHWRRKLIWAAVELAALIGVFFIWAAYRPEGLMSMEMDAYHFDLILFHFPIFALFYGLLLPLLADGDTAFIAASIGGFIVLSFIGLCCTDVTVPLFALILGVIVLAAASGSGWLMGLLGRKTA